MFCTDLVKCCKTCRTALHTSHYTLSTGTQSPDLSPIKHAFHFLKTKQKAVEPTQTEGDCSKNLTKQLKIGNESL